MIVWKRMRYYSKYNLRLSCYQTQLLTFSPAKLEPCFTIPCRLFACRVDNGLLFFSYERSLEIPMAQKAEIRNVCSGSGDQFRAQKMEILSGVRIPRIWSGNFAERHCLCIKICAVSAPHPRISADRISSDQSSCLFIIMQVYRRDSGETRHMCARRRILQLQLAPTGGDEAGSWQLTQSLQPAKTLYGAFEFLCRQSADCFLSSEGIAASPSACIRNSPGRAKCEIVHS